jgi:hypothetical protein
VEQAEVAILWAIPCDAELLFALIRRLARAEITASIKTRGQSYWFGSTVGDLIEVKTEGRKTRLLTPQTPSGAL